MKQVHEDQSLIKFELLEEDKDGFLVSGFSPVLQSPTIMGGYAAADFNAICGTNNCHGGNCAAGCGK